MLSLAAENLDRMPRPSPSSCSRLTDTLTSAGVVAMLDALADRWDAAPVRERITVSIGTRLRRSLGRADLRSGRIVVSASVVDDPALLREVLAHEFAHVVAHDRAAAPEGPHGPTWSALMTRAGYEPRLRIPAPRSAAGTAAPEPRRWAYVHRCPICQAQRTAYRSVRGWRCADCVQSGLPGDMLVERRRAGP